MVAYCLAAEPVDLPAVMNRDRAHYDRDDRRLSRSPLRHRVCTAPASSIAENSATLHRLWQLDLDGLECEIGVEPHGNQGGASYCGA